MKHLWRLPIVLGLALACLGLLPVPTPVPVPSASANVASFNSDCTQDVTQAMQNFLNAGGVHELAPGGCYKVNGKLTFSSTLDGKGAEIRKTSQQSLLRCDGFDCDPNSNNYGENTKGRDYCGLHAGMVELKSGGVIKNVALHRLGVHYYNPCHYAEHGIEVRGASNITIANVDIEGVWGDCLYMQGVENLLSTDLDCISNGRQGGAISKGRNIHLNGFYVRDSDRSGFDFEANGTSLEDGIYNVEIENFEITTDDDGLGVPEGLPDSNGTTQSGKIAFPSQGFASPDSDIYIHDGTVHQALSGIYDRQLNPRTGPGQCNNNRKNWRVENVIFDESVSDVGYGLRDETGRVNASESTFGSPRATAIFCGTDGVRFIGNTMPGGYLTLEKNTGNIVVSNNCFAGMTKILQSAPVTYSDNTVGGSCGGGTVSKPGAPIIKTAVAGNGQATVNFSAPTNNGGGTITGYTVTRTPGGQTTTGTKSPIVFSGLSNGTAYTFKVKATNSAGTGPDSAASNAVTPTASPTEPSAPTIGTATGGDGRCTVTFTAPGSNGGSAITSYTATSTPSSVTKTGTGSPLVVTGLQNGTAYTFKVKATNAVGTGAESAASNSCTPSGGNTVPTAPTIGTATAGDRSASVPWTAPSSNGGAAINAYIVYKGATTANPVAYTSGAFTRLTVINLTNETPYQFTVRAQNSVGLSPPSALSNTVIPTEGGVQTVPGAPTIGTASAGDVQATVTWTPPADDGGTQITGYKITSSPATTTRTAPGDVTSYAVPGLSNGTAYTFTVKATNAIGDSSASSASNSVTPAAQVTQVVPCELQDFAAADGLNATQVERVNDEMQRFCRAVRAVVTGSYTSTTPLCDNFVVDTAAFGEATEIAVALETNLRVACQGLRGLAPVGGSATTAPLTAPHSGVCDSITFTQQTGMDTNRTVRAQEAARNICAAFQRVVGADYDADDLGSACDNATVTPPSGTTTPTISVFSAAAAEVGWRGVCTALQEPPAPSACDNITMDAVTGLVPSEITAAVSAMRAACDAARALDTSSYDDASLGPLCSHISVTNPTSGLSSVAALLLQASWSDACFAARHLNDENSVSSGPQECEELQLTPLPGTDPADYQLALEAMREACIEALG